jgi:hypothetical protein
MTLAATDAPGVPAPAGDDDFALKVLSILFFSGFAVVATAVGLATLPPAGLAIAALVAWKGFDRRIWEHDDFALRVLSMIAFTAFATVATVLAFVHLPPAGLVLAAFFLWRGFAGFVRPARAAAPQPALAPTGNSAFDAYRAQTLARLEAERVSFEAFLARLREAKDAREFDQFLDDRAARARDVGGTGAE